ncbi:MAG: alpha/beta hydrolase [Cyanobacteria bacterium J06638_22]
MNQPHPTSTSFVSRCVTVRGVDYALTDTGNSGVPVLLLHGWPDDRTIWRHQLPYLQSLGLRVISVDWIGHGESAIPTDPKRYRISELGADTIALLDVLQLDRVHLIAHDYGATVSWETVANYPTRFSSYCALSVGHTVEILQDIATGHLGRYLWLILHGMDRASRYWYLSNEAKRFRHQFASHPDAERILAKLTDGSDTTFWTIWEKANPSYDAIYRHFFTDQRQKQLTVPTLGIYSRDDEWMTEGQLARSYKHVDAPWRYESMQGGHWVQLERPDAVNAILGSWLSQVDSC